MSVNFHSTDFRIRGCGLAPAIALLFYAAVAHAQVVSLQVRAQGGTHWGTAFVVSAKGCVATSFTLLENAKGVLIWDGDGDYVDVAGFVGASRRHDIVLLAGKNVREDFEPPPLAVEAAPMPGDRFVVLAGSRSPSFKEQFGDPVLQALIAGGPADGGDPMQAPWYALQLYRCATGAELLAGWDRALSNRSNQPRMRRTGPARFREDLDSRDPGQGADTNWLVLNMSLDPTYAGAPICLAGDTRPVGMVTGPPGPDGHPRLAVRIRHVDELLKTADAKPQPLSKLEAVEKGDIGMPSGAAGADPAEWPLAARVGTLAERFAACQQRKAQFVQTASELDRSINTTRPAETAPLTERINSLGNQISQENAHPAEAYTVLVTKSVQVPVQNGNTTTYRTSSSQVPETRYRLSKEQIARVDAWQRELSLRAAKRFTITAAGLHEAEFERPHAETCLSRAEDELFFLSDPCELGDDEDHRELESLLDKAIADAQPAAGNTAQGIRYLARGLCKLALRELDKAETDLRKAGEKDDEIAQLALMAEGRRLLLLGRPREGLSKVDMAARQAHATAPGRVDRVGHFDTSDVRLPLLRARVEIDRGRFDAAVELLDSAIAEDSDVYQLHHALAWLHASPPEAKFANSKKALDHAKMACELTGHRDGSCLAALAAAHARGGKFDEAEAALKLARGVAPKRLAVRLDAWEAQLAAKQPLTRDWKLINDK